VLVGNARKLRMIWQSRQKSDMRDAVMLARIARFDRALLCPIRHRGEQVQMDLEIIRARDLLVGERARMVNHVRSVVKSMGERLAASSTASFGSKAKIPEALNEALKPMLEMIRELTKKIRAYDLMIKEAATEKISGDGTVAPGRRRWAVDGAGVCVDVGRTSAVRQESHGRRLSWIGPAARSIGAN